MRPNRSLKPAWLTLSIGLSILLSLNAWAVTPVQEEATTIVPLKESSSVSTVVSLNDAFHRMGLTLMDSEQASERLQAYVMLKEALGESHETVVQAKLNLKAINPRWHAWVVVATENARNEAWEEAFRVLSQEHPQNAWLNLVSTEASVASTATPVAVKAIESAKPATQENSTSPSEGKSDSDGQTLSWSLIDPQHELLPLLVLSPERAFELQSLVSTTELKEVLEGVGDARGILVVKTMNQWQAKNQLARLDCANRAEECATWGRALTFTDHAQPSAMMGAIVWKNHCESQEDCAAAQKEVNRWNHWLDFPPLHQWLVVESQTQALLKRQPEAGMKHLKAQLGE